MATKLRDFRKSQDWTLDEMAERIGSSPASLSRIENGEQWPGPEVVARIIELSGGELSAGDVVAPALEKQAAA